MVEASNLVFVGQEISRIPVNEPPDGEFGWASVAVTFQVVEAYKGKVTKQMTLLTGSGGGDCGVGQQSGLVGITATDNGGPVSISICGSVHEAGAIAALLDPIELTDGAVASPPADDSGGGINQLLLMSVLGAVAATAAISVMRRRRHDWQDGWSSDF